MNCLNCSLFLNNEDCTVLKIFYQESFPPISMPHSDDNINERDSIQRQKIPIGSSEHKECTLRKASLSLYAAVSSKVVITAWERASSHCRFFIFFFFGGEGMCVCIYIYIYIRNYVSTQTYMPCILHTEYISSYPILKRVYSKLPQH